MGKNKRMRYDEYKPAAAMVGLQFIYAANVVLVKAAITEGLSPMVFIVYRQACASLFLAPATFISTRRRGQMSLGMKGFSLVFLAAFIGVTLNQSLYYLGLKLASASLGSAIGNMTPAVTFLMAAFVGLERVDMRSPRTIAKIFGTIICVGGAISMTLFKGPKLMSTIFLNVGEKWMLGCLFFMGSSCCWALWLILQVPICKSHLDPLSLSTWMCLLSSIQSAVFTFFMEPGLEAWRLNSWFEIFCCLYAGLVGSGMTFYVQSWCISTKGPLFSAMFSPLCTVVVTVFAILLLHEHLYIGSLLGGGAVVGGLYVVLWGKAKDYDDSSTEDCDDDDDDDDEITKSFETQSKEPLLLEGKLHDDTDTV